MIEQLNMSKIPSLQKFTIVLFVLLILNQLQQKNGFIVKMH